MRFLLSLLMIASLSFAGDYKESADIAKDLNKKVLLMVTTQTCPYCQAMKEDVIPAPRVQSLIEKGYVYVELDRDFDTLPPNVKARMVPTTFIIEPKSGKVISKAIGYQLKSRFIKMLERGIDR